MTNRLAFVRTLPLVFTVCIVNASDSGAERFREGLEERAITARAAHMKTDEQISFFQDLVRTRPDVLGFKVRLSSALLQKMRETTDFGYVDRAFRIVEDILKSDPGNYDALRLKTGIQLEYHYFSQAAESSRQLIATSPFDAINYGTLADALTERGDYDAAADVLQKMVDLRPDLASYNRVAHYRFLNNDVPGAIDIMSRAIVAGSSAPENVSWCLVELGNIYFKAGRLNEAADAFSTALRLFPAYHTAHAGLGRVLAVKGDTQAAIESYKRAQSITPMPDYAAALFDLYTASGKKSEAEQQRRSIELIDRLMQANAERANRNLSLLYSDHKWKPARALELAQNELAYRQDVYTFDALAWALYRNSRFPDAHEAALKAMKLNTPEPQFYFHASLIARALGNSTEADRFWNKARQMDPLWPAPER